MTEEGSGGSPAEPTSGGANTPADGGSGTPAEGASAAPAEGAPAAEGGSAASDGGEIHIETELIRDMGLVTALSIGVGTMIAAGIFTLSGLAVQAVGSAAIIAFLLAAVVATFTALTYCEFSSIYPESGEGYLYARKTFAPPVAYVVGWCLLLGYTSSCAFYLASFSVYFNEFVWAPPGVDAHAKGSHGIMAMLSGLAALVGLVLLNIKGTKESGTFQIVITAAKVVLLMCFVAGGIGAVDGAVLKAKFSTDVLKIGSTAGLVFITFFGFSAIAASAGEVKNPTKTIPRAIFISMGIVTVLYTLVVMVILAANLTEYSETAMGSAAEGFLGPIGLKVIVGGALFSMISASNASIIAGSRVALAMSQLGHLPKELGAINANTRTPVIALMLVGGGIGTFIALLPLRDLTHFADCVLLTVLILVNIALIKHRRMFPNLKRPFKVPLVPMLPALGILANLYLLGNIINEGLQKKHLLPIILAAVAVVLGFMAYLAWKGSQVEEVALPGKPSRVALERSAGAPGQFRVLVPIANPANVDQLIGFAATVAKQRNGEIVAVRVVVVPEQLPPSIEDAQIEREAEILKVARQHALAHDVPITSLVRVGHNAARAILETTRDRHCNLVVLGWKGYSSTARRILGEVTDDVVRYARADIMLVRLTGDDRPLKKLLLPTAGGTHAQTAMRYAANIKGEDGTLTLCSIVSPDAPPERLESEEERLRQEKTTLESEEIPGVETKILRERSVTEAILAEGEDYDAIVLGAAGQSISSQILFGTIPEEIARASKRPVIVIKRYDPVTALVGRVMSE